MAGVIALHGISAALKNQTQVDAAAAAASDAAFKSVMSSYGFAPNQGGTAEARDAATAAAAKARTDAIAAATSAGLSTAIGSGAPGVGPQSLPMGVDASGLGGSTPPAAQANVLGIQVPAQWKVAVEVGLGLAAVSALALLLRPRPPMPR